mmetsp:Transcript_26866/g.77455  ORF Transcript_26866/g.77455 Transcript_26866/m.77455 type:complete len:649 (-) Transcript_26866:272-2218(-)
MNRDTSRYDNVRPRFTHHTRPTNTNTLGGSGTTGTTVDSSLALALTLAASGGAGGGVGIQQDMEYDCESTASTSSSLSNLEDTDQFSSSLDAFTNAVGGSLQVRLVHPEYVDCSSVPDGAAQEDVDEALDRARRGLDPSSPDAAGEGGGSGKAKPSACNKATFPTTLFDILADPKLDGTIAWLPHGRSWKILDMTKFTESVLSSYFNQSKYTSFVRQVNGWGFRRVTVGSEANTYYHELFLRGRPGLLRFMRRQPASLHNTALRIRRNLKQVDQEADPDFYAVAESYPLPSNCPTNKASKGSGGKNAKKSTTRRSKSKSGGGGGGRGGRSTSSRRRQSQSKKRRSSFPPSSDTSDEDSKTKSRSSASSPGTSGGGGRKSRKNSGTTSPRDCYVEPTFEADAEEPIEAHSGTYASGPSLSMEGVAALGHAPLPADGHHGSSLAGFSWHRETDALTFLDDPEVQAHGQLKFDEEEPAPATTSSAWGMPPKPTIPTVAPSNTIAVRRHQPQPEPSSSSSMAFVNYAHSAPARQQYQQSATSIFPVESQNYASTASVHRQHQHYGQDQRVDVYQHRRQALDFHSSSYAGYATANSSASTLVSEANLTKKDVYNQASSAAPLVTKDSHGGHQQQDNQRLSASEILPMLQCLFD